jgi:hypothetical protein
MDRIKREPVAAWGAIALLLNAVAIAAVQLGYVDWTASDLAAVETVIVAIGGVFIFVARSQATSLADPHGKDIYPLVPAPLAGPRLRATIPTADPERGPARTGSSGGIADGFSDADEH